VEWRPVSAALGVDNNLVTSAARSQATLNLKPVAPECIGKPGCTAAIAGQIPVDFVPPLTKKYPLVQAFRITQPSNYARTVFIEALKAAGVTVHALPVAENPVQLLPAKNSYTPKEKVAELQGYQPGSVWAYPGGGQHERRAQGGTEEPGHELWNNGRRNSLCR
jgi:D-alanyl-D-alanine carboxypeptidase